MATREWHRFIQEDRSIIVLWHQISVPVQRSVKLVLGCKTIVCAHEMILDVTERNSVIEGLPPFTEETRRHIMAELEALSAPSSIE